MLSVNYMICVHADLDGPVIESEVVGMINQKSGVRVFGHLSDDMRLVDTEIAFSKCLHTCGKGGPNGIDDLRVMKVIQ